MAVARSLSSHRRGMRLQHATPNRASFRFFLFPNKYRSIGFGSVQVSHFCSSMSSSGQSAKRNSLVLNSTRQRFASPCLSA